MVFSVNTCPFTFDRSPHTPPINVKAYFLGKIRKNISKCRLLKLLSSMLSIKRQVDSHCGAFSLTFSNFQWFCEYSTGSNQTAQVDLSCSPVNYIDSLLYELTLTTQWADSADDKLVIFFLFFLENRSDTSCKLSPKETICMKCQIPFSRKNKKNISKCHLLKFLPSMQSVKSLSETEILIFVL